MDSPLLPCFVPYLRAWHLQADGAAWRTHSSDLLPVRWQGQSAILKVTRSPQEAVGQALMVWWQGQGAAQVYAHSGAALLLERLDMQPSLKAMTQQGQDEAATRILCDVAAQLHTPRPGTVPELPTLARWFGSLERAAGQGGVLAQAWATAQALLRDPQGEARPLHGDIHHDNVLCSARGWLAIDPHGVVGERGFDYANMLCNPTLAQALLPGRLAHHSRLVAEQAGLEHGRVLRWVAAYAGLSAAWHLEDGEEVQAMAALELSGLAQGLLH